MTIQSSVINRMSYRWLPHSLDYLKLNVNVTIGLDGSIRVGAVLRDHSSCIRALFALSLDMVFSQQRLPFAILGNVYCCFVPRDRKNVAYALAKYAITSSVDMVWDVDCPSFVNHLVLINSIQ
ncbi:hypothetical protein ACOSQ2_005269 [Xanthoceras sorbifolium]